MMMCSVAQCMWNIDVRELRVPDHSRSDDSDQDFLDDNCCLSLCLSNLSLFCPNSNCRRGTGPCPSGLPRRVSLCATADASSYQHDILCCDASGGVTSPSRACCPLGTTSIATATDKGALCIRTKPKL